jgi:hypothetical protein
MTHFDVPLKQKVKLILSDPDAFLELTFTQYEDWSAEVDAHIYAMPHDASRRCLLTAHRSITRRLRNRDYARDSRLRRNAYVQSLEEKVTYLVHECRRLESLLCKYDFDAVNLPLPAISTPDSFESNAV